VGGVKQRRLDAVPSLSRAECRYHVLSQPFYVYATAITPVWRGGITLAPPVMFGVVLRYHMCHETPPRYAASFGVYATHATKMITSAASVVQ